MILEADVRVWGDRSRIHKLGWLRTGDQIVIVGEYKNWRKFNPVSGCEGLYVQDDYPDYYFNWLDYEEALNSTPPEPEPDPIPTPSEPDDMLIGATVRIIVENLKLLYKIFFQ